MNETKNTIKEIYKLENWKHFKEINNAMYKRLAIIITCLKYLGVFPLCENSNGDVKFKWCSFVTVYSFFIFCIMVTFSVMPITVSLVDGKFDTFTFNDRILLVAMVLLKMLQLVPIGAFFERYQIIMYFNDWKQLQADFEEITSKTFNDNGKIRQLLFIITVLLMAFGFYWFLNRHLFVVQEKYNLEYCHFIEVAAVYSYFLLFAYGSLWINLSQTIMAVSKQISNEFKVHPLEAKKIRRFRGLWLKLRNLTSNMGKHFAFTYGIYMTMLFLINLTDIYIVALSILENQFSFILLTMTFFTVVHMNGVAEFAYRATKNVEKNFMVYILRLLENNNLHPEIENEVQQFHDTIIDHPPVISLGGFVTLNRRFNVTVCGCYITYLIIFLQMTPSINKNLTLKENATII